MTASRRDIRRFERRRLGRLPASGRHRAALYLAALAAGGALALAAGAASGAAARHPATRPAVTVTAPGVQLDAATPAGLTLPHLDLHDGTIVKVGATWYQYGTRYSCGNPAGSKLYEWGRAGSPWCGFGYSTARSLTGPWSPVRVLLSRWALDNWGPDKGKPWTAVCGGAGCFEPRMQRNSHGVWVLWFTAVADWSKHHATSYYALGCNGPAGPCGYQAGGPFGSTRKPVLHQCADTDDDPGIFTDPGGVTWLYCSLGGALSAEALDSNLTNGTGIGAVNLLPGLAVEATGVYATAGGYVMTYSLPRCGYCSGTKSAAGPVSVGVGHATASMPLGPWTPAGTWPLRRGQPNTVITVAGRPVEYADDWTGALNETAATVTLYSLPGLGPVTP